MEWFHGRSYCWDHSLLPLYCWRCMGSELWQKPESSQRDSSVKLSWPKQLRSCLTGAIPLGGDANLNRLKDKGGVFVSGIYSEKSSREVYTGNLRYR